MQFSRQIIAQERQNAYVARSKKARGWARMVLWMATAVFLMAVWQDRSLAPQIHDGMVKVKGDVQYAMENTDEMRGYIQGMFSSPSASGSAAKYDPITSWLIKWKDG